MKKNKGFTLLEVLIALTIVGMSLGTVYGLLAGSKRLAFKAADDIERTIFLRSALNAAQILEDPEYPELPSRYKKSLEIGSGDLLEKPEKQTKPMQLALESYSLHDDEKGIELVTVRLILMDTAK
ncbi:type II secretion system protein [Candidatus Halobeggiatoa sp. HSG11]|nr:type II secretion system protein [Candidatus Halobeggiatoa sp. HSG11]